jgi:PEGA domain-containing protein
MVAHIVLGGIVSVLTIVAATAQSPATRADAAEVEALIARGNELRRAGTPGPALPYFQKAYELARTPRTSGQLGLAELAAGYPVEAEEHLAAALQTPEDPGIVKYRKMLTDALTMARSQIGELVVEGSPAGAEVVTDGRAVGVLPLSSAIKLAARSAEVVVRSPGYKQKREVVPIVGGQRHALTVNLETIEKPAEGSPIVAPAAAPPSVPVTTPAPSTPVVVDQSSSRDGGSGSSTSTLRTAAWVAGGGAIVAAGAGLALNLAARSNRDDFNGSCVNMNGIHMVPNRPLTQGDCEARSDAWQTNRRWSIVGYVSGAALAVTSGILFWISRPTSLTSEARAHLTCTPTPTGISCQGVF